MPLFLVIVGFTFQFIQAEQGSGNTSRSVQHGEKTFRHTERGFEASEKVSKPTILMMKDTPDGFLSYYLPFRNCIL